MTQGALKEGRRPLNERTRRPEEAPSYAVGNRIKLEALIALHEAERSAVEIADMLGEDVKHVTNNLRQLYDAGCIEFVGHRGEGNIRRAVYRAVIRPLVDDETYRGMSIEERHDATGVALQWILAESLSSYRNGRMDHDEDLCLISDEPSLDTEGRRELRELLTAAYSDESGATLVALKSVQEIEGRAANRMAESGETGTTMVVGLMAFERGGPRT